MPTTSAASFGQLCLVKINTAATGTPVYEDLGSTKSVNLSIGGTPIEIMSQLSIVDGVLQMEDGGISAGSRLEFSAGLQLFNDTKTKKVLALANNQKLEMYQLLFDKFGVFTINATTLNFDLGTDNTSGVDVSFSCRSSRGFVFADIPVSQASPRQSGGST